MKLNHASLVALSLPLALLTGCPGDDSGSDDTTTTTTTTGETETNDTTVTPGTDTDEPGETDTDEPGTTEDPDSSTTEGPGEESRVRVMHLGVNAPGVDVYANGDGPVFDGLEFRNSTAYASVPSATYTFDVTVTGTPIEDAVLSPELTLDPDTAYTAVAIGDLNMTDGAPGLDVIALVDDAAGIDAANVRITVIHAAPAVGQVDVWEITGDPIPLVENVDYSGFTTLADIPAGPLEIGIDVDDDAMPDVTFSADLTPLAGQQINVYANNDDTGAVALVAQLGDGTVLTIPAN